VVEEFAAHLADPPPHYMAWLAHFHGAVVRVGIEQRAFPLRRPGFDLFFNAGSKDPAQINRAMAWVQALAGALQPYANGVYVNNLEDEGAARVREAYGPNYARLVALKNRYDPTNFFRLNQNVEPTACAGPGVLTPTLFGQTLLPSGAGTPQRVNGRRGGAR
jgi:hypothetical protein